MWQKLQCRLVNLARCCSDSRPLASRAARPGTDWTAEELLFPLLSEGAWLGRSGSGRQCSGPTGPPGHLPSGGCSGPLGNPMLSREPSLRVKLPFAFSPLCGTLHTAQGSTGQGRVHSRGVRGHCCSDSDSRRAFLVPGTDSAPLGGGRDPLLVASHENWAIQSDYQSRSPRALGGHAGWGPERPHPEAG